MSLVPEIIKNHRHVLLVVAYPSTEISISNGRIFGGEGIFFMRAEKEKSVKYPAAEFSKKKKERNLIKLIEKQSDKNQRV